MLWICARKDSTQAKMFGLLSLAIVSPFQGQPVPAKERNIVVKHSLTFDFGRGGKVPQRFRHKSV